MVTEDYVSFEVAKLLKEKGFNIPVWTRYEDNNEVIFGINMIGITVQWVKLLLQLIKWY